MSVAGKDRGARSRAARLAQLLRDAERAVVLTGAGISVPSGIPDFRSPGTGLWENVDPMEVAHIDAWRRDPDRFWSFYGDRFASLVDKRPNRAHHALAELERRGLVQGGDHPEHRPAAPRGRHRAPDRGARLDRVERLPDCGGKVPLERVIEQLRPRRRRARVPLPASRR